MVQAKYQILKHLWISASPYVPLIYDVVTLVFKKHRADSFRT
jgi:hypothetical protein